MTPPPNRARRPQACLAVITAVTLAASTTVLALATPAAAEPSGSAATEIVTEELTSDAARAESGTWTYRDTDTDPFTTLGVSWARGSDEPEVEFRTHSADGWSEWTTGVETAAAPEEARREGTDPIYVGASDGVEVRLTTADGQQVSEPEVSLIDPGTAAAPEQPAVMMSRQAAAAGPARPAIITRAQWGANESWRCSSARTTGALQAAIVHHTAGANSYSRSESAGIIRGIYAYHTRTLGWCDVGYNILIDKYGQIFEGRAGGLDKPILGAHATSWNSDTVGVSFMGNFETAAAPAVMMEAGAKVIAWKLGMYDRDPKGTVTLAGKRINRIAGHGDVMSTACPGRNVRSQMGTLRNRVAALMSSGGGSTTPPPAASTTIGARWQALGAENGPLGWPVKPEAKIAGGTWREFKNHDMFASPRTNAYWTTGTIRARYRQLGTANSALGFPTSDERRDWPLRGARGNSFENGAIVWTSSKQVHPVTGSFWTYYAADQRRRELLGTPSSDVARSGFGSMSQVFQTGRMFDNRGLKSMDGPIYAHWNKRSYSGKMALGQPAGRGTSVTATATGTRASQQRFTESTYTVLRGKAIAVQGPINTAWRAAGAHQSKLGLPVSDQTRVTGGLTQKFEKGTITVKGGKAVIRYS